MGTFSEGVGWWGMVWGWGSHSPKKTSNVGLYVIWSTKMYNVQSRLVHKPLNILKDQQKISMELSKHKILQYVPQRKHENFPNPRIVLHGRKKDELKVWMTN